MVGAGGSGVGQRGLCAFWGESLSAGSEKVLEMGCIATSMYLMLLGT